LEKMLRLPASLMSSQQQQQWSTLYTSLPPLPTKGSGTTLQLAPCQQCPPSTSNVENAELYPVHPYRLYTVARMGAGSAALQPAVVAFYNKMFADDQGWNQNAMDAALLGLGPEALEYIIGRAQLAPAPGYRFPVFMPHLQDYEPSLDHLAVFNNALQYMLMQVVDDAQQSVLLLPSWPCAWDVSFTLNAPLNTVVTGTLSSGKLSYSVVPSGRSSAVTARNCFSMAPRAGADIVNTPCDPVFGSSQVWSASGSSSGPIKLSSNPNLCLALISGGELQVANCDGSAVQVWTFSGGRVVGNGNNCLDIYGAESAPGAHIGTYGCGNQSNQQFQLSADGTIMSLMNGYCVTVNPSLTPAGSVAKPMKV